MDQIAVLARSLGPEIVYLAALAGIWLTVTAVYVPGTGLLEAAALATLALAGVGLVALEANAAGGALLVLALTCFLVLIYFRRHWPLILAGAIFQVVGSVFLFSGAERINPLLIIFGNAAALAFHQIVLLPGLRIQDRAGRLDADRLIGQDALVVTTLDPVGSVRLLGETWMAVADEVIEAGRWVRVVGREGLHLRVVPSLGEPRPFETEESATPNGEAEMRTLHAAVAAILLAGAGLAVAAEAIRWPPGNVLGPALAILIGAWLLARRHDLQPMPAPPAQAGRRLR